MKIKIKTHANSSVEKIKRINDFEYEVWLKEKPLNNKANISLIKILKNYFKKEVVLKSGFSSKKKIIEVLN
jgi:uncharacterized protein (TIGR00251 family)